MSIVHDTPHFILMTIAILATGACCMAVEAKVDIIHIRLWTSHPVSIVVELCNFNHKEQGIHIGVHVYPQSYY